MNDASQNAISSAVFPALPESTGPLWEQSHKQNRSDDETVTRTLQIPPAGLIRSFWGSALVPSGASGRGSGLRLRGGGETREDMDLTWCHGKVWSGAAEVLGEGEVAVQSGLHVSFPGDDAGL
ncbi:unnamed protein product [Arctogadus glacialis]